jgi:hypothetical protein
MHVCAPLQTGVRVTLQLKKSCVAELGHSDLTAKPARIIDESIKPKPGGARCI